VDSENDVVYGNVYVSGCVCVKQDMRFWVGRAVGTDDSVIAKLVRRGGAEMTKLELLRGEAAVLGVVPVLKYARNVCDGWDAVLLPRLCTLGEMMGKAGDDVDGAVRETIVNGLNCLVEVTCCCFVLCVGSRN
jgi:hypothetical protein